MKLRTLSDRSGVTVASIKFYRREQLLPAGERITSTSQSYGDHHLYRLRLISTLRTHCDTPISQIRLITTILDDPNGELLDALAVTTSIIYGLPLSMEDVDASQAEDPLIAKVFQEQGWPNYATLARAALADWVRTTRAAGLPVDEATVQRHAHHLNVLASHDLDAIGLTGAAGLAPTQARPSDDQIVTQAAIGMITYNRLSSIMRSLAYAGQSMSRMGAPTTRRYMGVAPDETAIA